MNRPLLPCAPLIVLAATRRIGWHIWTDNPPYELDTPDLGRARKTDIGAHEW